MRGLQTMTAPDHVPILDRAASMKTQIKKEVFHLAHSPMVIFGSLWFIWLVIGTLFYAKELNLSFSKAFYMAVNTGYSIGWGDIVEGTGSQTFSIFFVLCGSSFVAAALGFFAQGIIADRDNWYTNELQKADFENKMEEHEGQLHWQMVHWCIYHWLEVRAIVLWVVVITTATICALYLNPQWSLVTALYFSLSALSTGGLASIPADSPDWYYLMVGIYAALGVPVMAVAMATLAALLMTRGDDMSDTVTAIREPITELEVKMLEDFHLCDSDGTLDKAEFIILCMVRTGAATPGLVKMMIDYFEELDDDGSGALSLEELLDPTNAREPPTKEQLKEKMAQVVQRAMDFQEHQDDAAKQPHVHKEMTPLGGGTGEDPSKHRRRIKSRPTSGNRSGASVSPLPLSRMMLSEGGQTITATAVSALHDDHCEPFSVGSVNSSDNGVEHFNGDSHVASAVVHDFVDIEMAAVDKRNVSNSHGHGDGDSGSSSGSGSRVNNNNKGKIALPPIATAASTLSQKQQSVAAKYEPGTPGFNGVTHFD